MRKNIILLITFLFTITIFAQSSFTNGFNKGYKKGFCQDQGVGCIDPIPPIAPIPKIGESSDSYTDGYNRGFQMGLSARKNDNSSNNSTDRKRYKTSTSTFKSLSYDELLSVPMALQKRYNQNQKYLYALKKWILELKPQIEEEKYLNRLNGEYSVLSSMENDDLARATRILRQRENSIREIISEYNSYLKTNTHNNNERKYTSNNVNSSKRTTLKMEGKLRRSDSPISSVIDIISIGKSVKLIEKKGDYWKVFYNGNSGYLNEMYLNVTYSMNNFKNETNEKNSSYNNYNNRNTTITTLKMEGKLRNTDSPISEIISVIPKGKEVRVIEKKDSYWKIYYRGKTGYINEMYLNITYKMSTMEK